MTPKKYAAKIARREGKKSSVRISDVEEILKIMATMDAEYLVSDEFSWHDDFTPGQECMMDYAEAIAEKMMRAKARAIEKIKG